MEELLVVPIPHRFTCSICLSLLEDPVEHTSCDSIFCRKCIKSSFNKPCPICRRSVSNSSIKDLNRHLKDDFKNLPVKCTNTANGCESTCSIGTLQTHLNTCPFALLECGISGCCELMLRKHLENHRASCPFRLLRCEYCASQMHANEITSHFETCLSFPVLCRYCSQSFPRNDEVQHYGKCVKYPCPCSLCALVVTRGTLLLHKRNECVKRPTNCSFCNESFPLDQLKAHVNSCPSVPMQCDLCQEKFTRIRTVSHLANCPEALFTCNECQNQVARKDLVSHQTKGCPTVYTRCSHCQSIVQTAHHKFCPAEKLSCRFCNESTTRTNLANHLDICPKRAITCPVPGCQHMCKREELEAHWSKVGVQHVSSLLSQMRIPIVAREPVDISASTLKPHLFHFTQLRDKFSQVDSLTAKIDYLTISAGEMKIENRIVPNEKKELSSQYTDIVMKNNRKYGKVNGIWYDCEYGCTLKRCGQCGYIRPANDIVCFTRGFNDKSFHVETTFTCIRCSKGASFRYYCDHDDDYGDFDDDFFEFS